MSKRRQGENDKADKTLLWILDFPSGP